MSKVVNLTPEILRLIIKEEKMKIAKKRSKMPSGKVTSTRDAAKQTKEVEPTDLAHTLAKEVSHYKDLQAEAADLAHRLSEINEARQEIRARIIEQL
jgi:lipoate-protein ligase A